MKVMLAKSAGFCFGVRRAVQLAEKIAAGDAPYVMLGPVIHNDHVIEHLAEQGVGCVERVDQVPPGCGVIIRSHGEGKAVYDKLQEMGCPVADATCVKVAKIHQIVQDASRRGRQVIIIGDPVHPEVTAIAGWCTGAKIFRNATELGEFLKEYEENPQKPITLVSQTTSTDRIWSPCREKVKKECTNAEIFDTICSATMRRQQEAESLAAKVDRMIVVGGRHSSNTGKLFDICSRHCPTVWVETAAELRAEDFAGVDTLGITAGASTPARIIKEVQKTMSEILKEEEMSFEEMLNQSFKSTYTGEKVKGIVTGIAPNEITVDIGTKHTGYVPLSELTNDPSLSTEDIVKKGDEIELVVLRVNDVEGTVMLSKKRLDAQAGFEKVMAAAGTGEVLSGTVTDVVKGGILAVTEGVKVFIPASLSGVSKNEPLEQLLKQKVDFVIREVNEKRHRAVGSIKDVLKEQKKVLEDKFWSEVEVGKRYQGVVKSITSYGAFVDLGGVDGMVHISELSWLRIKHPSDVVKVGDVLDVYVKDIDVENKKISLGYKKTEDNPWEVLKRDYEVGSVVTAKVVSMTAFGAFAQIIPGVDGLIHISQISNERINKPQDVLTIGQEVQVQITDIDFEKKRVSLSMKALLEDNAQEEAAEASEETAEVNE